MIVKSVMVMVLFQGAEILWDKHSKLDNFESKWGYFLLIVTLRQ